MRTAQLIAATVLILPVSLALASIPVPAQAAQLENAATDGTTPETILASPNEDAFPASTAGASEVATILLNAHDRAGLQADVWPVHPSAAVRPAVLRTFAVDLGVQVIAAHRTFRPGGASGRAFGWVDSMLSHSMDAPTRRRLVRTATAYGGHGLSANGQPGTWLASNFDDGPLTRSFATHSRPFTPIPPRPARAAKAQTSPMEELDPQSYEPQGAIASLLDVMRMVNESVRDTLATLVLPGRAIGYSDGAASTTQ